MTPAKTPMRALVDRVHGAVEDDVGELAAVRDRLFRPRRRGRSTIRLLVPAALAGAVATTALIIAIERPSSGPSTAEPVRVVAVGDGRTVVVHGRVELSREAGVGRLTLTEGSVQGDFVGSRRSFTIHAGAYQVEVAGARFMLAWGAGVEGGVLAVSLGQARVTGPCFAGVTVDAGRTLRLAADGARCGPVAPEGSAASHSPPVETARDLLARGHEARHAGEPDRAKDAFATLLARYPEDPLAPDAVFALGVLAADTYRDDDEAERQFSSYVRGWPHGAFFPEALGRLLEAQNRRGATARARVTAERYLQVLPRGPHARLARTVVDASP